MPVRGGGPPTGGSGGGGIPRMPRGGGNPGPRPERYWTDYLRIALPVIGLILMLSVFIFWVGSIIDGNNDDADVTPTGAVALEQTLAPSDGAAQPSATVAATQSLAPSNAEGANQSPSGAASADGRTEPTTEPTAEESTAPVDQSSDEPGSDEQATEPPADGATFAEGDSVVTNDSVNLRNEASSAGGDDTIVEVLAADTPLTIVSGPENDGDNDWYEVKTDEGATGFVAADYIEVAAG